MSVMSDCVLTVAVKGHSFERWETVDRSLVTPEREEWEGNGGDIGQGGGIDSQEELRFASGDEDLRKYVNSDVMTQKRI